MHATRQTVRWLARVGYGARGVVYLIFGALALRTAIDVSSVHDVRGSLAVVHDYPGGRPVLLATAAGLLAYAAWRFVQSVFDTDHHGWAPAGASVRLALLVSAGAHVSLAWAGIKLALADSERGGQPIQHAVAATLGWPGGRELVVAGGAIAVVAGLAHIHKAWRAGFRRWFVASRRAMLWIDPVSRIGLCARGLLFIGVGGFVIHAGLTLAPSEALGVAGLLDWVRDAHGGRWLLAGWAIGVMLFGSYSLIEAFVRRVDAPPRTEGAASG